jgi:hypothetical protein
MEFFFDWANLQKTSATVHQTTPNVCKTPQLCPFCAPLMYFFRTLKFFLYFFLKTTWLNECSRFTFALPNGKNG